ncbi:beta-ketoacyl-[acyl-carrier-protein] synthase family protein [Thiococcus pfennigii]|uniref:beta-ketoacyl-[acyl-carrier-protein] synthase family protein n=1 Tax=Thiococcus pfennigii TaxID=1057 RepID=UPI0030B86F37
MVVTGMDLITSLGLDLESTWQGLVAGRSGIRRITRFDPTGHATQIGGQVPDGFDEYAAAYGARRALRQMGRAIRFGYVCGKRAVEDAGIDLAQVDPSRCAVVFGGADTGHSRLDDDKYWVMKTMPHGASAWLAMEYGLRGPNYTVSAACASSAYAFAQAFDLILLGRADLVIVGGTSSILNPEHLDGFNELQALSVRNDVPAGASRPFSAGRDGFVIGEGAGVAILESESSARRRGARIHARVLGHAMTSEAYNIMAPLPDGEGMARTMAQALSEAAIAPQRIDYINAHGSSTPLNDRYEVTAIKSVFGEAARQIPVSSAKSMIGHTAGACGAIEAIITILTITRGILTPTINYEPDPDLDLDFVPNQAREKRVDVALSNAFGFGGCNATLVLGRYDA